MFVCRGDLKVLHMERAKDAQGTTHAHDLRNLQQDPECMHGAYWLAQTLALSIPQKRRQS
eukprot:1578689-Amphidinium_carterae.2